MNSNTIKLLDKYDDNTIELDLSEKKIVGLLDLSKFKHLTKINCSINKIIEIINLPSTLRVLDCSLNKITELINLPHDLNELNCEGNNITEIKNLSKSLTLLNCSGNKIKILNKNNLPSGLKILKCYNNFNRKS